MVASFMYQMVNNDLYVPTSLPNEAAVPRLGQVEKPHSGRDVMKETIPEMENTYFLSPCSSLGPS